MVFGRRVARFPFGLRVRARVCRPRPFLVFKPRTPGRAELRRFPARLARRPVAQRASEARREQTPNVRAKRRRDDSSKYKLL